MRFKSNSKVQPELVASKDDARPVLTKIHLNAETSQVEVTDSYMLARFPVELDEGDTSGPIPVEALKAARKSPLKHVQHTKIKLNSHVEVRMCAVDGSEESEPYLTVPREAVDYTYPSLNQLVPENLAEFRIGLNAAKLAALAKAMGCGPNDGVELCFTMGSDREPSPLKPIVVRPMCGNGTGNNPDGVLMPIRLPG